MEDVGRVEIDSDGDKVVIEIDAEKGPRWGLKDDDWLRLDKQFIGPAHWNKWNNWSALFGSKFK